MKQRVKRIEKFFPYGTSGVQTIKFKTDDDMQEIVAIGFVETNGSNEQYNIGLKNPVSGLPIIDLIPKQLLIATSNTKNDDRYERLQGVEAKGKEYEFNVEFNSGGTGNDVNLVFAIKQISN